MQSETYQTARAHEEPYAIQFSVFMPNRVGQFCELLDTFADRDVQMVGVSVVDATDWAVIRMIFSDPNRAREVLRENDHDFTESAVLLAELDSDETLQALLGHLLRAEINVHFAFPLTLQSNNHPVLVLHVDDNILATQALHRHDIILLGSEDLADPI